MTEPVELGLFDEPVDVPNARVVALAGVLAGFRWPGRASLEALKVGQQRAVLREARVVLERLAAEPD